jgi:hypothetical protein
MAALRILQSREATWPAARDLLLRVTVGWCRLKPAETPVESALVL